MLTTKELSKKMRVSYRTILDMVKRGELKPTIIVGKTNFWDYDDVINQLKEKQDEE